MQTLPHRCIIDTLVTDAVNPSREEISKGSNQKKHWKKVSEKVGGAEGTKLDDDFKEMERKVDVTSRAVMEIMTKTIEYLQPNPEKGIIIEILELYLENKIQADKG
ncbi:hypothetical protein E5288_WYG015840 [Bos mutus]|uniref:BAR domain-containing protein n=1 Tax=Bos mutus TaxID=72004 RepID=A0A6B0RKQ1_9CETA|nr:hypothetical protein [Bos mutus]